MLIDPYFVILNQIIDASSPFILNVKMRGFFMPLNKEELINYRISRSEENI
jgi:hypothetical protein